MQVSLYRRIGDVDSKESITIPEFVKSIKEDSYSIEDLQGKIRRATDKKGKEMKKRLPAVTLSAFISTRRESVDLIDKIISHSGFINIDIDTLKKNEIKPLKTRLSQDKYTYSVHESIRGKGLTMLVKVDALLSYGKQAIEFHHKNAFFQIVNHYESTYGIEIDPLADVVRLRFLSVDKKIYINKESESFPYNPSKVLYNPEDKKAPASASLNGKQWGDKTKQQVYEAVKYLVKEKIDITDTYDKWYRLSYIFAGLFGEEGEDIFHAVSQFHPEYNAGQCSKKFNYALKTYKDKGLTPATFFHILSDHGINLIGQGIIKPSHALDNIPLPTHEPPTEYIPSVSIEDAFIKEKIEDAKKYRDEGIKDFPVQVFPESFRDYIEYKYQSQERPPELMALSMMCAISTAIGRTVQLQSHNGWKYKTGLFAVVVGNSGSGKSDAMKDAFKPLQEIQNEYYDQYKKEMGLYDPEGKEPKPQLKHLLIGDTTIEKLMMIMEENPLGVGRRIDELQTWMQKMAKPGSTEEGNYLSIFDGDSFMKGTKTQGDDNVKHSHITMLAGTQPSKIDDMAADGKDSSGFLFRFIFAICKIRPSKDVRELMEEYPEFENGWAEVIESVLRLRDEFAYQMSKNDFNAPITFYIKDNHAVFNAWADWTNEMKKKQDKFAADGDDTMVSLLVKTQHLHGRLIMLHHIMKLAERATFEENFALTADDFIVQVDSVHAASMLAEYFQWSYSYVFDIIVQNNQNTNMSSNDKNNFWKKLIGKEKLSSKELSARYIAVRDCTAGAARNAIAKAKASGLVQYDKSKKEYFIF